MNNEFNKKIVEDFGLGNMDSREQEKMIEKIGNMLFESVVERAVDVMDEEMMNDFDEVVGTAGSDYQKLFLFSNLGYPVLRQSSPKNFPASNAPPPAFLLNLTPLAPQVALS